MNFADYKHHCMDVVKHHHTDLDYDVGMMERGNPCLFYLREYGSHAIELIPEEAYPRCYEQIQILFGVGDRHTVLNNIVATHEWCKQSKETEEVLYSDGNQVAVISMSKADAIIKAYQKRILQSWGNEK